MDQEIIQRLKKVTLTEEEEERTVVDEAAVSKGVEDCKLSCLGKLYAKKTFLLRVLRPLIRKVWNLEKLRAVKIRTNVVKIFFETQAVMEKTLRDGPWCFSNNLLALQRWDQMRIFPILPSRTCDTGSMLVV
ncbi:hypothetical protein M9H77_12291 [Catharanthus roseus]|uniref:Uncharacterized protein n=1 Tax=Catharanthus roseus TaxID=4058 RepID=A0ACC0BH33_CATRO|nr:hypothetical protein M9H77_12291 [Catharanthus roseus]